MDSGKPVETLVTKGVRSVLPPSKGPSEHRDHADNYWTMRNRLIGISIVLSFLSVVVSTASVFFAVSALKENQRSQLDMKGIDLLVSFQKRYDDLAYDARAAANSTSSDSARSKKATEWYHRFWDLQFEQYQ